MPLRRLSLLYSTLLWAATLPLSAASPPPLSPATTKAVEQMHKLDQEAGLYGCYVSESLIFCSRVQDALVAYLHKAESPSEYWQGIRLLDEQCNNFRSVCNWVTSVINFYNPRAPQLPVPHRQQVVNFRGESCSGYFNTFKLGRDLVSQERERLFQRELGLYLRDGVAERFMLDATTFKNLEPEKIYNFALLPDGTIWAALERPGGKEYHVGQDNALEETFGYPNHTVLAGAPHQLVLTAGALILFQEGAKKLMFVSNKSGHYQPTFRSLPEVRRQIATFGIDEHAIILVPDVDLAQAVLKLYNKAQVPVAISAYESERLLDVARTRWSGAYASLDREVIYLLSKGVFDGLDHRVKETLARFREEATYMRSAYQLFSADHKAPKLFARLVLRFGKLKDAIHHDVREVIQKEAERLVLLMERYDAMADAEEIVPADADSFYNYLTQLIAETEERIARVTLPMKEYHLVKKSARELGTLFLMLADEVQSSGKNYFLYRASALAFLQVNELMRAVHDIYVGQILRGEILEEETQLSLSPRVCLEFTQYIGHLGIAPPRATVVIDPSAAESLINYAKDWYSIHYQLSDSHNLPNSGGRPQNPKAKRLLSRLVHGEWTGLGTEEREALALLTELRRSAEVARSALLLLDRGHTVPNILDSYIETADRIIRGVGRDSTGGIKSDAAQMLAFLNDPAVPTLALEEWVCTDQESFNCAIAAHLDLLMRLEISDSLPNREVEQIRDAAQAIADLMHLYRRSGLKHQTLPTAFYDTVADNCDLLVTELTAALESEGGWIEVTPESRLRAMLVTSRVVTHPCF